jgi:hypothetical protein
MEEPEPQGLLGRLADETIIGGALRDAYNALRLPGDVYAGRIDPRSDEAIKRAFDLAGSVTLGAGAIPAVGNELRMGIKAYHGSPHDFDQFSMDKIGTGEGAQAYGHGLYFAENRGTAKAYQDTLKQSAWKTTEGLVKHGEVVDDVAKAASSVGGLHPDQARQVANYVLDGVEVYGSPEAYLKEFEFPEGKFGDAYRAAAQRIIERNIAPNPGRMYEVDIAADPEHFLDWDRPLSEQAPQIKTALEAVGISTAPKKMENALKTIGVRHSAPEVERALYATGEAPVDMAEKLKALGVPGIRYLDAGSRLKAGGGETSNYVVFNDKLISILKKYGLPVSVLGASMLLQMHPEEAQATQK